jgi:hypothetical protein
MYRLNAAHADDRLGRLLDALRRSGQWDRTLLVVTANHGEELGENGQVLHGGSLARRSLEVPLVIKLPRGAGGIDIPRIAEPADRRVAMTRLWATLVEAAGGTAPPAAAPSLFRRTDAPALSELYLAGGANLFSLVDGDDQLLWETRFAPAVAFAAMPPLSGLPGAAPRLTLLRWDAQGAHPADDPARTRELARRLGAAWRWFMPDELPPAEERWEWSPAPVTAVVPRSAGTG